MFTGIHLFLADKMKTFDPKMVKGLVEKQPVDQDPMIKN